MDKDKDILTDCVDERIESFLRGTMSSDEEEAFKQEIKSNPELRNRAMEMTALIKGVEEHGSMIESTIEYYYLDYLREKMARKEACEKRARADLIDNELDETREFDAAKQIKVDDKKTRKFYFLWWACSAAAVCVIFFSVFKAQRYRTLDEAISPYYTQYDSSNISRGDTDSTIIIHLYSLFEQIQKQGNMTNVIKELEPIYASLNSDYTYHPYANDIAWNLALAYIKDDQIDKAIPILEKLKEENQDSPISVKSDELLQRIKDLR